MQSEIVQGSTLNWRVDVPDYPASAGWALRLVLNPRAGGTVYTVNSSADGDAHLVQIQAGVTEAWPAGAYAWQLWALNGGEQYALDQYRGQLRIVPGLLTAAAGTDTRSDAEIALDNVRATIRGTTSTGVLSYTINGRELRRYGVEELLALESKLATDVERERSAAAMAAGRPSARKVYVRMGRA
jgi:hypothetical protein